MSNAPQPIPQPLLDRCNVVLGRLHLLDEAVSNARAHRAMLEELNRRDTSGAERDQVDAIKVARAALLKSLIGSVMSALDRADRRDNRASVGQIVEMLGERDVAEALTSPASADPVGTAGIALERASKGFQDLTASDLFKRGKRLRDDAISHVLERDDPAPDVSFEDVYELHDRAEALVTELYIACGQKPSFPRERPRLEKLARTFWDLNSITKSKKAEN